MPLQRSAYISLGALVSTGSDSEAVRTGPAAPRRFRAEGGMAVATLYSQSRLTRDVDLDFPAVRLRTAESLHNQISKGSSKRSMAAGLSMCRSARPAKPRFHRNGRCVAADPEGDLSP